jgi:hypothetical protein
MQDKFWCPGPCCLVETQVDSFCTLRMIEYQRDSLRPRFGGLPALTSWQKGVVGEPKIPKSFQQSHLLNPANPGYQQDPNGLDACA